MKKGVLGIVGFGWLGRALTIELAQCTDQHTEIKVFDSKFACTVNFGLRAPNTVQEGLDLYRSDLQILVDNLVLRGLVNNSADIMQKITLVPSVDLLDKSDVIFECIKEDVFAKQQILCLLDAIICPKCILASACISAHTDVVTKYTKHAHRIVTCIWVQPIHFIPQVYIASGTKEGSLASAQKLAEILHGFSKKPIFVDPDPTKRNHNDLVLVHTEALRIQAEYAQVRGVRLGKVVGITHYQRVNNFSTAENENLRMSSQIKVVKLVDNVTLPIMCTDVTHESENFKTFTFSLENSNATIYAVPGQVCKIQWTIDGKPVPRFYAILSPTKSSISIGVQLNIGFVSAWLDKNMTVGITAELVQTFGNPFLTEKSTQSITREKFLFVAGGTGITPLISMMKWLGPLGADLVLLYSVKGPEIPFLRELLDMELQFSSFKIYINVTKAVPDLPYKFYTGRLNEEKISTFVNDIVTRVFYVLGPREFMLGIQDIIQKKAYEEFQKFLTTAKTGPDNQRPEDADKCWQPAYQLPTYVGTPTTTMTTATTTVMTTIFSPSATSIVD